MSERSERRAADLIFACFLAAWIAAWIAAWAGAGAVVFAAFERFDAGQAR